MGIGCAKTPNYNFLEKSFEKVLTNQYENAILYRHCARGNSERSEWSLKIEQRRDSTKKVRKGSNQEIEIQPNLDNS